MTNDSEHERLGHQETAAMLALMVLGRAVRNPDLETVVGFTLVGKSRRRLNDMGLLRSDGGRPFVHTLTDRGLKWCRAELGVGVPPPPAPRSTLAPALYVILAGLDRYLRRENLRLTDLFAPDGATDPADVRQRVRSAYRKLATAPRAWVGLVELRELLGDVPAQDVDTALKELSRTGQAILSPTSNRKLLTPADHAAAIRIGGEDNHRLLIEAS
jgi:hypothetical protein